MTKKLRIVSEGEFESLPTCSDGSVSGSVRVDASADGETLESITLRIEEEGIEEELEYSETGSGTGIYTATFDISVSEEPPFTVEVEIVIQVEVDPIMLSHEVDTCD